MSAPTRAAFFDGVGRLALREIELPDPGPGEALLEVGAAGVCGSDLHQLEGRWSQPHFAVGHEIAGVVLALGPDAGGLAVGDRVCVEPFLYCGRCRFCLAGRYFLCPQMGFLSLTAHGGLADRVLAPAYALHRLPECVSLEVGALAEPLAVAVHAARLAAVSCADGVLVLGAGTIGLMSVAAARFAGSQKVCVTARHPHQAEAALALGADAALSPETKILATQLPVHFPEGPDVVMESVGSAARTFQLAIEVAGKLGRVALMGGNTGTMDGIDLTPVILKELTILGSGCYAQIGLRRDFSLALEILASRPQAFERLITHRFPLEQVAPAFDTALDKGGCRAIKVMVVG